MSSASQCSCHSWTSCFWHLIASVFSRFGQTRTADEMPQIFLLLSVILKQTWTCSRDVNLRAEARVARVPHGCLGQIYPPPMSACVTHLAMVSFTTLSSQCISCWYMKRERAGTHESPPPPLSLSLSFKLSVSVDWFSSLLWRDCRLWKCPSNSQITPMPITSGKACVCVCVCVCLCVCVCVCVRARVPCMCLGRGRGGGGGGGGRQTETEMDSQTESGVEQNLLWLRKLTYLAGRFSQYSCVVWCI